MDWMLWTLPTAIFFVVIAVMLIGMTVWQIFVPTQERRGWIIPMQTTRGDRLFIGLLTSAYLCALWITVIPLTPWLLLAVVITLVAILLRWG